MTKITTFQQAVRYISDASYHPSPRYPVTFRIAENLLLLLPPQLLMIGSDKHLKHQTPMSTSFETQQHAKIQIFAQKSTDLGPRPNNFLRQIEAWTPRP